MKKPERIGSGQQISPLGQQTGIPPDNVQIALFGQQLLLKQVDPLAQQVPAQQGLAQQVSVPAAVPQIWP
jgi:hypothetical protein